MEGVPLKIPQTASFQEVKDDVKVPVPDYLNILQKAEYEFSLENWVLAGLQSGFSPPHRAQPPSSSSSGPLPSCPPYWMMFSSPQQSRLASRHSSDFWEPNPRQRSHSLNPAVLRAKFTISDSDDEGESAAREAKADLSDRVDAGDAQPVASCQRRPQRAFVPDLLNPPTCLSSLPHQRRKNLRQCSVTAKDVSTEQESKTERQPHRPPNNRANTVHSDWSTPNALHMRSRKSEARSTSPTALPPRGLSSALDSSVELLSALSPEERELLGAITARGYPLRTAIIALQRMGQQTPDQVFSYLVAYEHLCQLGYDMAQVEEALEMFQNCEAKAEEFLHLLSQFNEMGFQQNAIKEVLLVHENHRERALEELMMRVA